MRNNLKNSILSFSDRSLANLIQEHNYSFNYNDIIAGTVISKEEKGILVDIGTDIAGFLPIQEITIGQYGKAINLEINDKLEFIILHKCLHKNYLILSMAKIDNIRSWQRIKVMHQEDITTITKVLGYNRGGVLVTIESLCGFIPNSHLISKNIQKNNTLFELKCKILEIDRELNRLTLSEKCALLSEHINELTVGKYVYGTIEDIKPYGLLIKVKMIQGLLHKSEIPNIAGKELSNLFCRGENIKVKIIYVDLKKGRVSFSMS
uniref:Ribosomal protein S1 n=1 Tax=Porphyridium sordidum TaxID=28024 RepID=A0A1C9CDN6_PORSO|nr:ribosomal protein S1 [Porphyridium sordidum]AOM66513.1 ribosomal protein S1 [Porphyridium sordidum]